MSSERGFLGELMHRRVPQYLGVYIAAVWLGIEIGDWLSDQFALPARLTAYIFVFMAVLLPSVAVFAWNHGAPGKDHSPAFEKFFVPLNILLAASALLVVPPATPQPSAAVAAAAAPPPVVAQLGNSQRMLAYFWQNETADAPDWIAYGVPFLLGEDMDRASPGFLVTTPFTDQGVIEAMRRAGFERAVNVPQSLQLKFAKERQYNYYLAGAIADADDGSGLLMNYVLHDGGTGATVLSGSEPFTDDSLLTAIDRISVALQAELAASFDTPPEIADLPMAESMSAQTDALRFYIEARIADDIDRDTNLMVELLTAAVAADPQFAEAHALLGISQYLQGQSDVAQVSLQKALDFDYRLSRESVFNVRINREMIAGDAVAAADIARVWTQIEPDNASAFRSVARLNQIANLDLDVAQDALKAVRVINPTALDTLREAASIEQQRGDLEAAERYLREFLAARPDSVGAATSLAEISAARGNLEAAMEAYQQASYIDSKALGPELGRINIMMRLGDFASAEDRLSALESRDWTDQQRLQLMNAKVSLFSVIGQYENAIAALDQYEEIARRVLPPLLYNVQFASTRATFVAFVSSDASPAISGIDALRAQLQPPWVDFMYWFDLTAYSLHGDAQAYAQALEKARIFMESQNNANLDMMLASADAQLNIYAGDPEAAIEDIDRALLATESSVLNVLAASEVFGIRVNMYDLMRQAGQPQRAIEGLLEVVEMYPGLAVAHLRLAQAYFDAGDVSDASDALSVATDIWRDADPEFVWLKEALDLRKAINQRV